MKSNKTSGGNLRDFRIDERLPFEAESAVHRPVATDRIGSPRAPVAPSAPPPRQTVAPRQNPSLQEWSVSQSSSVTENSDALWESWADEAGAHSREMPAMGDPIAAIDLSRPIEAAPTLRHERSPTPRPGTAPAPRASAPTAPRAATLPVPAPQTPTEVNFAAVPTPLEGQARTESSSNDMVPWAADLALEERRMERTGTVDYTNQYARQELLKSRTREFTSLLQKLFREHVETFNESRRSPAHQIHVYKVTNSAEDFMLYRNHVKLVVSGSRAGKVIFAFNQYLGQIFAPAQAPVVEIEASWGPFDQLYWSYKGERVVVMDLVRYFLTEFTRQSFR